MVQLTNNLPPNGAYSTIGRYETPSLRTAIKWGSQDGNC